MFERMKPKTSAEWAGMLGTGCTLPVERLLKIDREMRQEVGQMNYAARK